MDGRLGRLRRKNANDLCFRIDATRATKFPKVMHQQRGNNVRVSPYGGLQQHAFEFLEMFQEPVGVHIPHFSQLRFG
jgi:hypothetical protein